MATEEELLRAKKKYTKDLLARRGVHAVGIGLKKRGGKRTNELSIVCFVDTKLEMEKLDPGDRIPPLLDGVPTDVQVSPVFKPFTSDPHDLQQEVRPVAGGLQLQVGESEGTLGFLGMLNDSMVAVSNQHVLEPDGETNFQPTNGKHNDIGTTTKLVLSDDVDGGYTTLDAATGVAGIYKWNDGVYRLVPVAGAFTVTLGSLPFKVWKTGCTTGTTYGHIVNIFMTGDRDDHWHFEDQLGIESDDDTSPFSSPGDSGAAILSDSNQIVGLLWGGGPRDALGSPIAAVMAELDITVATSPAGQLQQPVLVPQFDQLLAKLNSSRGEKIARFLIEYGPLIRDLIYTDSRVMTVWTRHHGHEICNAIIENVATKSIPLPAKLAGASTLHALEEFGAVLIKRGSPDLHSAIETIRGDIEWLIDRPYADVAGES